MTLKLDHVGAAERAFDFQPDDAARAEIAKTLALVDLPHFAANVTVKPWLDGAEIHSIWKAVVVQTCGLSLENFETVLAGDFLVRVVPPGSPNAPDEHGEVVLDLDADDPPDVAEGQTVDLGAYLIEHLSLELDPFPRKPGAVFEPPEGAEIISPFASLRNLKP